MPRTVPTSALAAATVVLAVTALADTPSPQIRPGDEVLLDVPSQPELSGVYAVDVRGNLTVPPARPCRLARLDTRAGAGALVEVLAEFYRDLDGLAIRILRRRLAVRVEGRVGQPGDYILPPHANLEDALLAAGDIRVGGLLTRVIVDRDGAFQEIDLRQYRITGDPALLPPLATGDRIFVPVSNREAPIAAALAPLTLPFEDPNVVHLLGLVANGGTHSMPGELSLFEALALGGGPAMGADPSKVRIIPPDGASYLVDLDACAEGAQPVPAITAGTAILVPEKRQGLVRRTLEIAIPVIVSSLVIVGLQ